MNYDTRSTGKPSVRHESMIRLLDKPAIMASGISKTIFLSSDPNELCERLKLLLQKNTLEIILKKLMMKSLLYLINCWNTNGYLKNNINKF